MPMRETHKMVRYGKFNVMGVYIYHKSEIF